MPFIVYVNICVNIVLHMDASGIGIGSVHKMCLEMVKHYLWHFIDILQLNWRLWQWWLQCNILYTTCMVAIDRSSSTNGIIIFKDSKQTFAGNCMYAFGI